MFMIEREKLRWMITIQLPCAKILTRANWKVFIKSSHPANRLEDEKYVFLSVTQAARKKKNPSTPNRSGTYNPLGPVVRTPVSTNPGLNFDQAFFFLLSKALPRIIFSVLFRVSNHQIVGKKSKTEFEFEALISEFQSSH